MNILTLINALPGAAAQGLIWGNHGNWCLSHLPYPRCSRPYC